MEVGVININPDEATGTCSALVYRKGIDGYELPETPGNFHVQDTNSGAIYEIDLESAICCSNSQPTAGCELYRGALMTNVTGHYLVQKALNRKAKQTMD